MRISFDGYEEDRKKKRKETQEKIKRRIGDTLLKGMEMMGLNRSETAVVIGVNRCRMKSYIEGKQEPRLDVVRRIAKLADISIDEMLKGCIDEWNCLERR